MTTILGSDVVTSPSPAHPPVPPALRARRRGWRDPRMWVGVVLVSGSVLLGSAVLSDADEYAEVWAVRAAHGAGSQISRGDLAVVRVRFGDDLALERYWTAAEPPPQQARLVRPIGAGELLPRAAVGDDETAAAVTVPLALPAAAIPPGIGPGSRIEVWVSTDGQPIAARVFEDVSVLAAPRARDEFGAGTERQLVVGLTRRQADDLDVALATIAQGAVTVVGVG